MYFNRKVELPTVHITSTLFSLIAVILAKDESRWKMLLLPHFFAELETIQQDGRPTNYA